LLTSAARQNAQQRCRQIRLSHARVLLAIFGSVRISRQRPLALSNAPTRPSKRERIGFRDDLKLPRKPLSGNSYDVSPDRSALRPKQQVLPGTQRDASAAVPIARASLDVIHRSRSNDVGLRTRRSGSSTTEDPFFLCVHHENASWMWFQNLLAVTMTRDEVIEPLSKI
jgi:hypothetical protein